MRRLGRYIYNGLTVLSLLICLVTVVLWVRAYHHTDRLAYHSSSIYVMLVASPSGMLCGCMTDMAAAHHAALASSPDALSEHWYYDRRYDSFVHNGFVFSKADTGFAISIGLPYWLIFLITAAVPAARLTARLRRKRPPPGLCPKCRYDLRATPDRCPECGTVVAEPSKKRHFTTENTEDTEEERGESPQIKHR